MNTDRFLTRVWDKQEKKMLYDGDMIGGAWGGCDLFANSCGFCFVRKGHIVEEYYYEDRFVPMQCTGFREDYGFDRVEDGAPAYEFDIIKSHMSELFLITQKDGCWVANLIRGKKIINRPVCDLATLEGHFSVRGNKFENPELLVGEK